MGQEHEGHDGVADVVERLRRDDPEVLARLLDVSPYLVLLLDPLGQVLWTNDAVERMFGYTADEVVGTNILDHVDPEWDPGALGSIGEALDAEGLRLPAVFQVIAKDGTTQIVEVWANAQMKDPVLGGLVAYVRRWDERVLLDRAFESLAAGDALEQTLRLLVQVMASETLEAHGAVVYDTDGRPGFEGHVAHADLHPAQREPGSGGDESPWERARRTGQPMVVPADELPELMRKQAEAAGHKACWVWPVSDEHGAVEACLVAWRRGDELEPDFTRVRLLESLVRLARLAFERQRTHATLEHAATHDPLTHVPNRAAFYGALDEATRAKDGEGHLGVLYLDLDGFKPVNDRFGHGAGDDVLVALARRLSGSVRDPDLVARIGGDEFAVLCPQVVDPAQLEALADRLVRLVAEPFEVRGEHVTLGASIGVACASWGAATADELVEAADRALYRVKGDGKGGWAVERLPDAEAAD